MEMLMYVPCGQFGEMPKISTHGTDDDQLGTNNIQEQNRVNADNNFDEAPFVSDLPTSHISGINTNKLSLLPRIQYQRRMNLALTRILRLMNIQNV
jgi:hypothetical protein